MDLPFHRLFSMPAFEGLRITRHYCNKNPEVEINDIIQIIQNVEADANSFDLEAAKHLHGFVCQGIDIFGGEYYQCCINDVILHRQPSWAKLMRLGRTRFVKKLSRDESSIFRQAGLLMSPPSDEVIKWWDDLSGRVRLAIDTAKMEQARKAEKLTLDHERERLKLLGITEEPIWTAIEDNTAGYDVQSYNKNDYGLINRLIEVKSTIASPLRFNVSRNEWEQAIKFDNAYIFHIWDMKPINPILYERAASDVAPHIPSDNEKGKWTNALIPLNIS